MEVLYNHFMTNKPCRYIDAHSHITFAKYDPDRGEVVARMQKEGVWTIGVGVDFETSKKEVEFAEKYEGFFATVGLHPHDNLDEVFDYDAYKKLAAHPRVVGIGECGLDYSRIEGDIGSIKRRQCEIFSQQIKLANELNKPLMLHIRPSGKTNDAYDDAYEIVKREAKVKGNVHFFAGDVPTAQKFIDLGFTLSFTGVLTFARNYDEVVRKIPLDMILSETDAPFVAPVPYRGKRNESTYVIEVVKKIAEIRGEEVETVQKQLVNNTRRVFSL